MATPKKKGAESPAADGGMMSLEALVPWDRNYNEGDVGAIYTSIRTFGFNGTLRVWNGTVVAGNHAWKALWQMKKANEAPPTHVEVGEDGEWMVPITDVSHLTWPHAQAFAVADNRTRDLARSNDELLAEILQEVANESEALLRATGYSGDDLDLLIMETTGELLRREEELAREAEGADMEGAISDEMGGAFQLKDDMRFPSKLQYGIPELDPDMMLEWPENGITLWPGDDLAPGAVPMNDGLWLYNWASSCQRIDWSRAVVSYYVDDFRFEGIWNEPSKHATRFLNAGVAGVVSPNFSLWTGQAPALHIYQVYRTRWVARYFQSAGIRVAPDVDWGDREDWDFCFDGIPVGCPLVVKNLQTFGAKDAWARSVEQEGIRRMIDKIQPKAILFYASKRGTEMAQEMGNLGVQTYFTPTYMDLRRGKLNDNKKSREGRG